ATAVTFVDGGQQHAECVEAGDAVAQADVGAHGRGTPFHAGDVGQSTRCLGDRCKAHAVAVRAVLPELGDAHQHGGRVDRLNRFPAEVPFFELTGTEVLDHDVALRDQLAGKFLSLRVAKVERHQLLVS